MSYGWKQGGNVLLDTAAGRNDLVNVHVFGRAPNGVQITPTDVWDRADSVPTQSTWLAPTEARVHDIVSTSALDTAGGAGARSVQISGLTSWDADGSTTEIVPLDGVTPATTANAYVVINSMVCATYGASGPNVGTITATAQTDDTVSVAVLPGNGDDQTAVYGFSSSRSLAMARVYAGMLRTGGGASIDVSLLIARDPASQPAVFSHLGVLAITGASSSTIEKVFEPPALLEGPAIIKIHATASVAGIDLSAGFDGLLVRQ
jgi:hypothetical protein